MYNRVEEESGSNNQQWMGKNDGENEQMTRHDEMKRNDDETTTMVTRK